MEPNKRLWNEGTRKEIKTEQIEATQVRSKSGKIGNYSGDANLLIDYCSSPLLPDCNNSFTCVSSFIINNVCCILDLLAFLQSTHLSTTKLTNQIAVSRYYGESN